MKDLIVLVADLDTEYALRGLLTRPEALGIRGITFDIFRHPRRDPGCLLESVHFLRGFTLQYQHGLVFFDHEGCGREADASAALERTIDAGLTNTGWADRAASIILVPELEIWVWSDSPQVDAALGWAGRQPALRPRLVSEGWTRTATAKPGRPKEAMHAALRVVEKVPSASIFQQLGRTVSFRRCADAAFQRLLTRLREWFPS